MMESKLINIGREILITCWRNALPVFFSADLVDVVFETRILSVKDDNVLLINNVPLNYISKVAQSQKFVLQAKMLNISSRLITTDGKDILFSIKDSVIKQDLRKSERVYFDVDEHMTCEFINPFDNKTVLSKQVLDMSSDGIAIKNHYNSKLFEKDLKITGFKILINGNLYMQKQVEVIYKQTLWDFSKKLRTKIGLKFLD